MFRDAQNKHNSKQPGPRHREVFPDPEGVDEKVDAAAISGAAGENKHLQAKKDTKPADTKKASSGEKQKEDTPAKDKETVAKPAEKTKDEVKPVAEKKEEAKPSDKPKDANKKEEAKTLCTA